MDTEKDTEKAVATRAEESLRAVETLRAEIAKRRVDVEEGTIVRFLSASRTTGIDYIYGAVYAADHWWITGTQNYFGGTKFTNDEFLELVAQGKIFAVEVAVKYEAVK
ncbi:hypothetical protein SEA_FRANSOYER_87 [Microbacterium phage Fransoyer]|nr:hypothetical protein SEA_FRANSOYER_87 [Microbacterium phage Fransoyer]